MWVCPKCDRTFKSTNQSHWCSQTDIDTLFVGKPDELLLAFDKLLIAVIDWPECTVGAATRAIIFAKGRAWLIIKPMSKQLDLKFYHDDKLESELLHKHAKWNSRWAHHVRISVDTQVTAPLLDLLRKSWANA